jgi:hypothetical protein
MRMTYVMHIPEKTVGDLEEMGVGTEGGGAAVLSLYLLDHFFPVSD